jgi:dihydrofolate synthase/folylpolyglutamate synthase
MTYQETLHYLYTCAPMFQQMGSSAYKEGLDNTYALDDHFHHPHRCFRSIHVAGTNGKGSCSHTLAAILQSAGYKVGLYTSPHIRDFRERIRINGIPVSEQYVIDFVEQEKSFFEPLHPSFFELTTAMAFKYFAEQKIDVAVVEVGLGGRLDCTNIIMPDLSIITNISFDHIQFLGNTLSAIASEKAGIIKKGVPVVIGEALDETRPVFERKAQEMQAPICFAEEKLPLVSVRLVADGMDYDTRAYGEVHGELGGLYQQKNTNTVLTALPLLIKAGYNISEDAVRNGFAHVCELTGLEGRWQCLQLKPELICDTGHNVGGITYIVQQLKLQHYRKLHIVFGMVNDKDITGVLALLPREATYYFTRAVVKRALPEDELKKLAVAAGLQGETYPDVPSAVRAAQKNSLPEDFIYVGGSSYIVSDLLTSREALDLH